MVVICEFGLGEEGWKCLYSPLFRTGASRMWSRIGNNDPRVLTY